MPVNLIPTLASIGAKPGTSRRDMLTITRRVVRNICEHRQEIHDERHAMRRQAAKLREHLPFTKRAAAPDVLLACGYMQMLLLPHRYCKNTGHIHSNYRS